MKKNLFSIGKKQVRVPIVQGGMGVGISLGRLAGTVAKEGGAGTISAAQIGFKEPDFYENPIEANKRAIHKEMQKARAISPDGIVGFNLMVAMNDYETYAHEVIAAGADFIVSGAGLPVDLPAYTADSDIAIAPIVSTQKSAHVILKFWDKKYKRTADFIVIEGPMAGGHLGFHKEQLEEFTPDILKCGNISLNIQSYELSGNGQSFVLPKIEYKMMEALMLNRGIFLSTEDLLVKVWGYNCEADIGVVWVYISYLRKRLSALKANVEIKAKRNVGYKLEVINE